MSAGMDYMRAAHKLAKARKERGLSQADLGETIGSTQSAVSRLEGIHEAPEAATVIFRWASALGFRVVLETVEVSP